MRGVVLFTPLLGLQRTRVGRVTRCVFVTPMTLDLAMPLGHGTHGPRRPSRP